MSKNATKIKKAAARTPGKSWEQKCKESDGMMMMLPASLSKEGEKFGKVREFTLKEAEKFDAVMEDFKHANEEFWYGFKKYCRENDIKIPDKCELGLDNDALDEGKFVINFLPKMGPDHGSGPMVMR